MVGTLDYSLRSHGAREYGCLTRNAVLVLV